MDDFWNDIVNDKVEFTWTASDKADSYVLVIEGQGVVQGSRLEGQTPLNKFSFPLENFRMGYTVEGSVSVNCDGKVRELYPAKTFFIGSIFVVRNLSASLNPTNPRREINVSFDKPEAGSPSKYNVEAIPISSPTVREEDTQATKFTLRYLKSNTTYVVKVKAIFEELDIAEVASSSSLPVTTHPNVHGDDSTPKIGDSAGLRVERSAQDTVEESFENPYSAEMFCKLEFLGEGQFGRVYSAEDKKDGRKYALKKLHRYEIPNLDRELELPKTLKHENLVACYGHYSERYDNDQTGRQTHVLVMELMERSLKEEVDNRNGISEDTAKRYTRNILEGLRYLHQKGIVHRDIKSDNILLKNDQAKIGGYGSLKTTQLATKAETLASSMSGTPYFMSPELIRGETYTKNTDIWSLGCTVVEMITTKPPIKDDKGYWMILLQKRPTIPILPGRDVSPGLREFLRKIFVPKEERPYSHELCSDNPWC